MAFMMPVVKNDYDIYAANRSSRRSSSASIPRSRRSTRCDSNAPSLSCSPGSDVEGLVEERLRSASELPPRSRNTSQCTSEPPSPKSASHTSLHKFHSRLVDKLKKTLRIKDDSSAASSASSDDVGSASTSKTLVPSL